MNSHQFPQQYVLCDEKPFSHELLRHLLDTAFDAPSPFTGYFTVAGIGSALHFLFFFKGAPYAAGRYVEAKPVGYSIQEFGKHLASSTNIDITISLCETDPVLLKCMLLFLQTEPDIKAPTSLINFDHIIQQIGESGANAMITMSLDHKINFFFFKDGKAAVAYYSDSTFQRPKEMSIDEEMQLYAFHQPGDRVHVSVFRSMSTSMAEDLKLYDKESLFTLLTVGYLKNRRKEDRVPASALATMNKQVQDPKVAGQAPMFPTVVLTVESGPLQGERLTVTLPCTIGRENCDVIFNDRLVSRRHAVLKILETKLVIEDLASKNGTRVNGEAITRKQLTTNDQISFGSTRLRISPA